MGTAKSLVKVFVAIVLAVVLSACGFVNAGPAQPLVEQAIALELSQTQQLLSQQLRLEAQPTDVSINHVRVTEKTPLKIQNLPSYRVRGTYDLTAKLANRQVVQRQNLFEVYLQRQIEGKTWRLARLQPGGEDEPIWVTYGLSL